jgi:hypothetical protein
MLAIGALAMSGVAYADNVQSDVDSTASIETITAGGSTTVGYRIAQNNGDGQVGCNASDGSPATVNINHPQGVTASATSLTFNSCGTFQQATFGSSVPGTYLITVTVSDGGIGTYNLTPATWTLRVLPAPTNTPPTVEVGGVVDGATYEFGNVPAATCEVTDAEDENPTATPVITGTLTNGLGELTATCDYTDEGDLDAQTATATYTIADTGSPAITYTLNPDTPDGANDWYTVDVEVDFECSDDGSGIDICAGDTTLSEDGADQSVTGTATDFDGNTATATADDIDIDQTDPEISYTLSPVDPDGLAGWYTSAVQVTFECADETSGVETCEGSTTILDGSGQTVTGTATDLAGNTTTLTTDPIDVDSIAPSIDYTLDPAAPNGENDWYVTDVEVDFTCADSGSGLASCVGDTTLTDDGAGQSATGSASDVAGNTATVSATGIDIDQTGPEITYSLSPADPAVTGWFTSAVEVTFHCEDETSGVASCEEPTTILDGEGLTVDATATDVAGNTTTITTDRIDVDTIDPTIGHTLSPSVPNGVNGWYTQDVTVDFTCADGGSGIDTCEGDVTLGEGEDQSATGTATDVAGRTASDTVIDIDIDKTDPLVSLVGGPSGSYVFGSDPAAPTCSASDALSGLASCVVTGGGTTVGSHSYVATATDNAGNSATATLSYTVLAWNTLGYYAPVDMGGVLNTVKGGSTVPLKFELFAGPTELTTTSAVASFKTREINCNSAEGVADAIEILSTGGTSLRYDSTGGQFVQNWKTPVGAGRCYSATMTSLDGSTISALFKIK